ncbi:hypothetical protein LTS18_013064, partial [Coniosporium uncinatum]
MCWPEFDSPSIFCRLLDQYKGAYFTITPQKGTTTVRTKQRYLPSSNVLQTRFIQEIGVLSVVDFFPRPVSQERKDLKKWLPKIWQAFNYTRDEHTVDVIEKKYLETGEVSQKVIFRSKNLSLELNATVECAEEGPSSPHTNRAASNPFAGTRSTNDSSRPVPVPDVTFEIKDAVNAPHKRAVAYHIQYVEQRQGSDSKEHISSSEIEEVHRNTHKYWHDWISKSQYKGRYREVVERSLMILKLLTYVPTGAIVAAATFGLPEDVKGARNWDYRSCWVRDSSFVIYILLRIGFQDEAERYMTFMSDRFRYSRLPNGALPIMFSIRGSTDLPGIELGHLEGYRKSRPVRVGNGAATHKQLDIYGELMDAAYLYDKFGKPVSYDQWVAVRDMTDFVCNIWTETDESIWE